MSECEKVTYTKEVRDANGKAIFPGSVLKNVKDESGDSGVVLKILKDGDYGPIASAVGDLVIEMGFGSTRITNQYDQWIHVPHDEQTYEQRFLSWQLRPYEHDEYKQCSAEEGLAADGIMSLLPSDVVNWDTWEDPWPDTLEGALRVLMVHLSQLKEQ